MARLKQPTTPAAPTRSDVEGLTASIDCLGEQMAVQADRMEALTREVEVLRIAVDDLRQEVEWAMRDAFRKIPTIVPATSISKNPYTPNVGQPSQNDVAPQDTPPSGSPQNPKREPSLFK